MGVNLHSLQNLDPLENKCYLLDKPPVDTVEKYHSILRFLWKNRRFFRKVYLPPQLRERLPLPGEWWRAPRGFLGPCQPAAQTEQELVINFGDRIDEVS